MPDSKANFVNSDEEVVQISATTKKPIKEEAVKILDDLGVNLSSSIDMFLRCVVRTGGIDFLPLNQNMRANNTPRYEYEIISVDN